MNQEIRFVKLPLPMALAIRDFLGAQPINVAVSAWSVLQLAIDQESKENAEKAE